MHDVLSSETVVDSDHLTNKSISNVRRGKKPYQIADMLFSGNLICQDEAAGLLQGKAILISTGSGDPSTAAWERRNLLCILEGTKVWRAFHANTGKLR